MNHVERSAFEKEMGIFTEAVNNIKEDIVDFKKDIIELFKKLEKQAKRLAEHGFRIGHVESKTSEFDQLKSEFLHKDEIAKLAVNAVVENGEKKKMKKREDIRYHIWVALLMAGAIQIILRYNLIGKILNMVK